MLLILCGHSQICSAHQKFLWPNVFSASKVPVWISFDVTWSDHPFFAETGVGDQPITLTNPDGKRVAPSRIFIGKTKSTAEAELTSEGTYRLEAVDELTYWTRIEKDGREQWIKKPKNEVTGEKITRADLYWAKALAYVVVGKGSPLLSQDAGDPLEIRPTVPPNEIFVGSPCALAVSSFGKPAAGAEVKVYDSHSTGHDPLKSITCDDQGVATFQPESAGMYLFSCELEQKQANDPKADVHSFNFYLTLLIRPEKK
jgi:uncharacterized GH25 family protein